MKKHNQKVAARVARLTDKIPNPKLPEGVTPLNPGYFRLEQMRMSRTAEQRTIKAGNK